MMQGMPEVIATVNGRPIKRFDLDNAIQGYSMETHRKTMDQLSPDELQAAIDLALEKLLARELIFQAAMARGLVADEEQIAEEKRKIAANFPSEAEFYATLAKGGISAEAYHRMLRQDVTVNMASAAKSAELVEPDEADIRRFYEHYPGQLVRQGRVRASHILIRIDPENPAVARELMARIQAQLGDTDFAELARRYSQCPSAPGGGDLGYFRRGDMVREFEQAVFAAKVGEVVGPVQTQFGLHLVKLLDHQPDSPLTLEEARPKIIRFLRDQQGAKLLQDWVAELRALATIEIFLES